MSGLLSHESIDIHDIPINLTVNSESCTDIAFVLILIVHAEHDLHQEEVMHNNYVAIPLHLYCQGES